MEGWFGRAVRANSTRLTTWMGRLLACSLAAPVCASAVEIDGVIDPVEWSEATRITDFRRAIPLTGEPASLPTQAWILATPDGLAIAFRNEHPVSVPRTEQRVQRDFEDEVDRVDVMIDFDGDSRVGYIFTLSSTDAIYDATLSNEREINPDWDGVWAHAVARADTGWTAEILIPWHIAPMRSATGSTRTLKIYVDRVIAATGEHSAWPLASQERARFLSDFAPLEVTNHTQSLLAVTPYVSAIYDNVDDDQTADAGADLFWKPNGQMQLTATVNPDFGQVESDDLVVNFDATETFISDKRPFFTENQAIFDFTTPSDYSQLLYTRRVGGPADDGNGAGDIIAALKLNGSIGSTKYGLFGADEADSVGRTFTAMRLVRDFATQNLGLMLTNVERPYLDRKASVLGFDHDWRPTARWNIRTRVFGSDIEEAGSNVRDSGATVWADYEMDHGWRQQWIAMHFGNDLEINDAGYLARNSTNYLHWQVSRRFTDLPQHSRYTSKDWRGRVSTNYNDHGELLNHQLRISREGRWRDGSYEYGQVNINSAGRDDLITRGHGSMKEPWNFNSYFEYERPRKGNWGHTLTAELYLGGLEGDRGLGYSLEYEPTYYLNDAFNMYVGFFGSRTPSWLLWQYDNVVGSFDGVELHFNMGFNWIISNRQELRLKVQAISVEGEAKRAYEVASSGEPIEIDTPLDDFGVMNLGIQLRYRYELAPLSYLYIVYGRGGYDEDADAAGSDRRLRDTFALRDDEQLFVKLSYRFER